MDKNTIFDKKNRIFLTVVLSTVIWCIFRFLLLIYVPPESLGSQLEPTTIIKSNLLEFSMAIYFLAYIIAFTIIFTVIQEHMEGNKLVKGTSFGMVLASIWYFGLALGIPSFFDMPFEHEMINAFGDAIPVLLFGIISGLLLTEDNKTPRSKSLKDLLPIFIFIIPLVAIHWLYSFIFTDPTLATTMVIVVILTLEQMITIAGLGLLTGIMYFICSPGIRFQSEMKNHLFFAVCIFGFHWIWFNFFFNLHYVGIFLETMIIAIIDTILVFLTLIIVNKVVRINMNRKNVD
ncbi:MAG: hypothetical protein ACFFAJ_11890 [Candidatus Hodarchaeota archaeon]